MIQDEFFYNSILPTMGVLAVLENFASIKLEWLRSGQKERFRWRLLPRASSQCSKALEGQKRNAGLKLPTAAEAQSNRVGAIRELFPAGASAVSTSGGGPALGSE